MSNGRPTNSPSPTPNSYEQILLAGGGAAITLGSVIAIFCAIAADKANRNNELMFYTGGYWNPNAGSTATGAMWFGIALAAIGLVSLIIFVSIRAARSS